jgi:hypothetical protein
MLTAKFSVHPVDKGWVVRMGPDVLVMYPTKNQAILNADWRATAIRRLGGCAVVVEEQRAATESQVIAPAARGRPGRGAQSHPREP